MDRHANNRETRLPQSGPDESAQSERREPPPPETRIGDCIRLVDLPHVLRDHGITTHYQAIRWRMKTGGFPFYWFGDAAIVLRSDLPVVVEAMRAPRWRRRSLAAG